MNKEYALGIELGSTRIKSVLIDSEANVIASGSHEWENVLVGGLWSYPLEAVEAGLRASYAALTADYKEKYGKNLTRIGAIGISAMMHGYLAFDKDEKLLVPFRTWRNTNAERASLELSELMQFHIPQRWSVSHYYQAVLDGESHVKDIAHLTTLAGYVHYRLTGKRVLGIGDASGMFPVYGEEYDREMLDKFNTLLSSHGIECRFEHLLPKILPAGAAAGELTAEGARFLDPTGALEAGCVLCPPEGDVGTGMIATDSVREGSANISAGTSAFLVVALKQPLSSYYKEIDVMASPTGGSVAMVHANNFTSEINAWANLFEEVVALGGGNISRAELFGALFSSARSGAADCGGLVGYNFLAGEPVVGAKHGTPLIARSPGGTLSLASFMKMQIYSALGALAIGCEIFKKENMTIDTVCGHGGFFKSGDVSQSAMSAALGAPVTVMQNAGEGGAWGIAVLALFSTVSEPKLDVFLDKVFANAKKVTVCADEQERADFALFLEQYKKGLAVQRLAAEVL